MENKQPIYKKWWFWVIIVVIFALILNGNKKNTDTSQEPAAEASTEATAEAAPEDFLLSYFTEATGIKEASIKEQKDSIEIVYTLDSTPYDYTDYVSKGLTHFVDTAKLIYGNTDCDMFRMDMQVDGSAVTSLIITRDNFESIDWSSMAFTEGIYDQIQGKFQKFYVESTLMKDVDTNKIMYKGN